MKRPVAIDCFAGAGGLSLGIQKAGFDVRAAFDIDELAVRTYVKNLGAHCIEADATKLSGDDLLSLAGVKRGEVALLAGGPPCQGFSTQRRGDDVDVRNDLVLEFGRLIEEVLPTAFIMENVAGARGRRGALIVETLLADLSALGYVLSEQVVDAADFGVPQHRRRLLIVGILNGDKPFVFPEPTHGPDDWLTVREAIGDLPDPFLDPKGASRFSNHEQDNISDLNRKRISYVPEGGGRADIPEELQLPCHRVSVEVAGHRGVYGRLSWDMPAGTITTKCNSFTRGRFAHPVQDRNISMREAARLQGFADDFVFEGSKVDVAHQIGNAVPPPLATNIAKAVLRQIRSKTKRSGD